MFGPYDVNASFWSFQGLSLLGFVYNWKHVDWKDTFQFKRKKKCQKDVVVKPLENTWTSYIGLGY